MPGSLRNRNQTKVYRAGDNQAGKHCTMCGRKITRGSMISYSRDGIQKTSQPHHVRCPYSLVTVRHVDVT